MHVSILLWCPPVASTFAVATGRLATPAPVSIWWIAGGVPVLPPIAPPSCVADGPVSCGGIVAVASPGSAMAVAAELIAIPASITADAAAWRNFIDTSFLLGYSTAILEPVILGD